MTERDDPFGRRGEEEVDPFGRPHEAAGAAEQKESLWLPPRGDSPPAAEPAQEPPSRFLPPTDAPPDKSEWWSQPAPPVAPGAPAYRPHAQAAGDAAEWMQRAGAAVIDFFIRLAIVLAAVVVGAIAFVGGSDAGGAGTLAGLVVGGLASLAYAPWMIATRNGQTVGHRATDTRIVRRDGGRLGGGPAFVREVLVKGILFEGIAAWISFGIAPLLNYLWPLWDDRNETLHDKMCNTRVVRA